MAVSKSRWLWLVAVLLGVPSLIEGGRAWAKAAPAAAPAPAPAQKAFKDLAAVDVPGLKTDYSPEQVAQACEAAEKASDAKLAALVAIAPDKRTFANTVDAMEQAITDYGDVVGRLAFLKDIHPDAKVRAAGAACEERSGKYFVELGARKDLYLAIKGYADGAGKTEKLAPVDRRLLEINLRDFRRNGLELPDDKRKQLVDIRQKLTELGTKYSSNLDENTDSVELTKDELAGLPDGYVGRLKKAADGKYIVTTKYPDYFPLMENGKNEGARKKMYFAFNGREAKQNLPLLTQAIALRDQAAKLLGYPTHADYVTEDRMAKNAKSVSDFLSKLRTELKPRLAADNHKMLALKIAETKEERSVIQDWDWLYYLNQIKKHDYSIDDEQVRSYFPADKVMAGMFQVYSTLFGVTFTEVPKAQVWADGVKLYEVHEGQGPGGKLLAKFYVDMFPRDGKYGHAASFPIGVSREVPNGYQIPLSALVVNFNPPQNGQSAKLSVDEVDTLFHEFGHIMHGSLTTARYSSLAGTNVATDFVEAPSQMLENWVFRPEVLKLITVDPKDPSKTMPDDLIKRIVAARKFDAGVKYSRQVFLATFDQALHTHGEKVDPDAIDHQLRGEIMGYPVNADEHFAASFGHLMGGYDAGYYGYLWSEVFAADMFTRFEKEGVLNPATGKAYRDAILAKGRTEEPMELLKQFLGREPNEDAFLRLTGIKSS